MRKIFKKIRKHHNKISFQSKKYWEKRYKTGGNSGSGSYKTIAEYKAKIVNDFIDRHNIKTTMDLGCGDGNQLKYLSINKYIGFDVSKTAISICRKKFSNDKNKTFFIYNRKTFHQIIAKCKPELALSLDVIFHLVEDNVYKTYIRDLFDGASDYVIIFSTNYDEYKEAVHHKNRRFDDFIEQNIHGWKLYNFIKNPYKGKDTNADFYIYKKVKLNSQL